MTIEQIEDIEHDIGFKLPNDYKRFLQTYGYGAVNEYVLLHKPDKDFFRLNFNDCIDFWKLTKTEQESICNGVYIASNFDGGIILLLQDVMSPFIVLPRHAEEVIYFESFDDVLTYYKTFIDDELLFFISNNSNQCKSFNLNEYESLDKNAIDIIQALFIKEFTIDKVVKRLQPIYILQNIGGLVSFDLVYKSSINIQYQERYKKETSKVIDFIETQINKLS